MWMHAGPRMKEESLSPGAGKNDMWPRTADAQGRRGQLQGCSLDGVCGGAGMGEASSRSRAWDPAWRQQGVPKGLSSQEDLLCVTGR